jgi:hypothetical protein
MKNRINDDGETKKKGRDAYKARSCIEFIISEAYSSGIPPSRQRKSISRRNDVSSRVWPVEKG